MKKFIKYLVVILIVLLLGAVYFVCQMTPQYTGALALDVLEEPVEVHFDEYGVPHIYGQSEEDTYRAFGYLHAQDRLWQMELLRRIAPGRLSEVFGTATIDADKFFKTLGINEYSVESVKKFESGEMTRDKKAALAYLEGVNAFVDNGATPIEFMLLGVEKSPFTILDVYNTLGYMSFSFATAFKTEPLMSWMKGNLGSEYMKDLDVNAETGTTMPNYDESITDLSLKVAEVLHDLPVPNFIGSNSWVIGPEKTESGAVILANDAHISYSQPTAWYEAHLEWKNQGYYGYFLAGFPFGTLAHNRKMGFGVTMFLNDDIDFFTETINPDDSNQYLFKEEWLHIDSKTDSIIVKDAENVAYEVRSTHHGALVNEVLALDLDVPISFYWSFTEVENDLLEGSYGLTVANSMEEFQSHIQKIHAPGLNINYGDVEGNYARWSLAKLFKRPVHVEPKYFLDGSSGNDELEGFYSFDYNPSTVNAPNNYAFSANNRPDTTQGVFHAGHYCAHNRASRIVELLEGQEKWNVESTKKMMLDSKSPVDQLVNAEIVKIVEDSSLTQLEQEVLHELRSWDGIYLTKSVAPTIYSKLVYLIHINTMKDEIGDKNMKAYFKTHVMDRSWEGLVLNDSSLWWDDVSTEKVENRRGVILSSFRQAVVDLENQFGSEVSTWQWSKALSLNHPHALTTVDVLASIFDVGDFPVNGGNEVINNYMFTYDSTGQYVVGAGPSERRIIDFADIEHNSWSILPTGNSGNRFSKHYKDQAQMYVNGEFRRMLMDKDDILDNSQGLLHLSKED